MTDPLLVRAARRERVERTPVWFMRQAGRSLPEYRAVRARHDLFSICRQPDLCAEVTLQPVERLGVDAAVIYSDIMVPVVGMGIGVELVEGVGPLVGAPVRRAADLERLRAVEPEESAPGTLEAIRLVRQELAPDRAVVGFAGGPFTVASYLVEGRPSRTFAETKRMMYGAAAVWHGLMERLADGFRRYVDGQVRAGADVIQLFDSWAGALSRADYDEFVAPYSRHVLSSVEVPTIHFAVGAGHLVPALCGAGGDVIGVDWRRPLSEAWESIGPGRGIQGNLDPATLLGPFSRVDQQTRRIIGDAAGRPGHIFNLGHGVLPETDPGVLGEVASLVRDASRVEPAGR